MDSDPNIAFPVPPSSGKTYLGWRIFFTILAIVCLCFLWLVLLLSAMFADSPGAPAAVEGAMVIGLILSAIIFVSIFKTYSKKTKILNPAVESKRKLIWSTVPVVLFGIIFAVIEIALLPKELAQKKAAKEEVAVQQQYQNQYQGLQKDFVCPQHEEEGFKQDKFLHIDQSNNKVILLTKNNFVEHQDYFVQDFGLISGNKITTSLSEILLSHLILCKNELNKNVFQVFTVEDQGSGKIYTIEELEKLGN